MDSFRLSIFDLFGAIIPGVPTLILITSFIEGTRFSILNLVSKINQISLSTSLIYLLIAYLIGFSTQYLSYELFKKIAPMWGKKRTKGLPISFGKRGKEISMIREKAPENYKVLNTFFAHRTMSYNAFFSLFIFGVGIFILNCTKGDVAGETITLSVLSIIFSIILLRRAVSFHEWGQNLISDSMVVIKKMKKP